MENIGIGGLIGRGLTLEHKVCYFVHYTAERIVIVYYTAKGRDVLGRTMYIPNRRCQVDVNIMTNTIGSYKSVFFQNVFLRCIFHIPEMHFRDHARCTVDCLQCLAGSIKADIFDQTVTAGLLAGSDQKLQWLVAVIR